MMFQENPWQFLIAKTDLELEIRNIPFVVPR